MSDAKRHNLGPYSFIPLQAVSGDVTSAATNIKYLDNINVQLKWTGTLLGTFIVNVSNDYDPNTLVGTWDAVPLVPTPAAAGSPDHGTLDLNNLNAIYIQVIFDYTSGSGNLSGTIAGKAL